MERWQGRVAIVTGASSGIGEAIARVLAQRGMRVVAVARRLDKLQALAAELKGGKGEVHPIQGDVTKEDDVIRVVTWARENLGGADVLINNAGVAPLSPLTDFKTVDVQRVFDTNVVGLCVFTRELIKDMKDRKVDDGHVINIGSITGHEIINFPGLYPYSATKHAVKVLTEGLRRELRDLHSKIRVTEVSPGLVETEILHAGMPLEVADGVFANNTYLKSEDIADAVVYALGAPSNVQVHEMIVRPAGEDLHRKL